MGDPNRYPEAPRCWNCRHRTADVWTYSTATGLPYPLCGACAVRYERSKTVTFERPKFCLSDCVMTILKDNVLRFVTPRPKPQERKDSNGYHPKLQARPSASEAVASPRVDDTAQRGNTAFPVVIRSGFSGPVAHVLSGPFKTR